MKKKRFFSFAQVFITISKYSECFYVKGYFIYVMTSCMPMASFGDVIHG